MSRRSLRFEFQRPKRASSVAKPFRSGQQPHLVVVAGGCCWSFRSSCRGYGSFAVQSKTTADQPFFFHFLEQRAFGQGKTVGGGGRGSQQGRPLKNNVGTSKAHIENLLLMFLTRLEVVDLFFFLPLLKNNYQVRYTAVGWLVGSGDPIVFVVVVLVPT